MQGQRNTESGVHGDIYQLKLLMLFLYRGVTQNYSFRLGTEIKEAKKFDDLVFEYKEGNNKFYRLLQAKHKLDESIKITENCLLTDEDKAYSLVKYFFSYQELKEENIFGGGSIKDVTVCTNINFNFQDLNNEGIQVEEIKGPDGILDMKHGSAGIKKNPIRYKFHKDIVDKLTPKIIRYYPKKLANYIVNSVLNKKMITPEGEIYSKYHKALSNEVIDVKNKVFYDTFCRDEGLSNYAQDFRNVLQREFMKQTKNILNIDNLNDKIRNKTLINNNEIGLTVRGDFGKGPQHCDWPKFNNMKKNIAEFIDHLVFAVQQPNEQELGETIMEELGSHFNEITTDHVYNKLFQRMLDLLQNKSQRTNKRFYTCDEGKKLINDARKDILSNLSSDYKDQLDDVPYKFKLNNALQIFLCSGDNLWLLPSNTPWLSSLFLHQSFNDGNNNFSHHIFKWIDVLQTKGKLISDFKGLDDFVIIVICFQTIGDNDAIGHLVAIIDDILYAGNPTVKVIVVASEEHEFMKQLTSKFPTKHGDELLIEFDNLEDASQEQLLERKSIIFHGDSKKVSTTQLLCAKRTSVLRDQIDMLNLDALAIEILFMNSNIEISFNSCENRDFIPELFKTNTLLTYQELRHAIQFSCTDNIFAFSGVEDEVRNTLLNSAVELKKLNEIQSPFTQYRFILLHADPEDEEFFELCRMIRNCRCSSTKHVVHKLNFERGECTWTRTYSQNFYIPRLFIPPCFDDIIKTILVHSNSSQFIMFRGMEEPKLLRLFNINSNVQINNLKHNCIIEPSYVSYNIAQRKFNSIKKTMLRREVYDPSNTYQIASHLNIKTGIHWIQTREVGGKLQLEWQQSVGDVSKVRLLKSLLVPSILLTEEDVIKLRQRLLVFADDPGSGKSCTMTHFIDLILKKNKESIAIKIDLAKHQNLFPPNSAKTKQDLIELLLRCCRQTRYEHLMRKILGYKLEFSYQVTLLCDGFDEMKLESGDNFLLWVKFVMETTKASVWISTRCDQKQKLENSLSVLSYCFKPLDTAEANGFLSAFGESTLLFFGRNPDHFDFRKVAERIKSHIKSELPITYDNELFQPPLLLRMLAEKYTEVMKYILIRHITDDQILESEIQKINAWDIYEAFVQHTYEIYFDKMGIKRALDEGSERILLNAYSKAHRYIAANQMLNNNRFFSSESEILFSCNTLARIALVHVHENYRATFIHTSFEEYFATEFLCINLETNPCDEILWNMLLNGILIKPFSSRLFDYQLRNRTILPDNCFTRPLGNMVYKLLLEKVDSGNKPVALWVAAKRRYVSTYRFLLKCLSNYSEIMHLLQLKQSNLSLIIDHFSEQEFEISDFFFIITLQRGSELYDERDGIISLMESGRNFHKL